MNVFRNSDGKCVLMRMVKGVQDNKVFLGDVDGLIGDGDHGANMNKGFTLFETMYGEKDFSFTEGLGLLGDILFSKIGGSMGPIYGTLFMDMSEKGCGEDKISPEKFAEMLEAGLSGLQEVVEAKVGDKTLIDTLVPAVSALKAGAQRGEGYPSVLEAMKESAAAGRDSTKDMVAKFGRSSRLGERSRGVLDAGAASCCILLTSMADGILQTLE